MAREKGSRAVFLDRDGVINEVIVRDGRPASPRTLDEFRFCEGITEPLEDLAGAGFRLFVVTNQPDVSRGMLDPSVLRAISARILETLPIERVLACIHDDSDECACRKPKPGLLQKLASSERLDLSRSFMFGDSWRDVHAGYRAGCTTILLQRDYNRDVAADYVVESMAVATKIVLGEHRHGNRNGTLHHRLSR